MKYETQFKIILTLFFLVFLMIKINPKEILSVLANTNIPLILLAVSVIPPLYMIRAYKWNILLKEVDVHISFLNSFEVLLIGMFYGMITPGKSGEFLRAFYIDDRKSKVIPTILWARITDVFALIILSGLAVIVFFNDPTLFYVIFIFTFVAFIGTFFLMNRSMVNLLARLLNRSEDTKETYLDVMWEIFRDKETMLKIFLLSFGHYFVNIISGAIILRALDPEINLLLVFFIPFILLFGNIPITISGLGLREFVTVLCFSLVGAKASIGFSFSILLFFITILLPGLAGYAYMLKYKASS